MLYIQCSDDMLWNGNKEDGNIRRECEEAEGTDCEGETVTLSGKGRWNQTWFVYIKCMQLVVKYFFLADILFWEVVSDLDKYILLWQMCVVILD